MFLDRIQQLGLLEHDSGKPFQQPFFISLPPSPFLLPFSFLFQITTPSPSLSFSHTPPESNILKGFDYEVRRILVKEVTSFLLNPSTSTNVLSSRSHVLWALETCGEGFRLPVDDDDIIQDVTELYRFLFFFFFFLSLYFLFFFFFLFSFFFFFLFLFSFFFFLFSFFFFLFSFFFFLFSFFFFLFSFFFFLFLFSFFFFHFFFFSFFIFFFFFFFFCPILIS